ncbi:MAG: class I SAM-dependent methyltransferase [Rickettsia endosymbiont of Oxypoda opaca]|nr:class I SAM-dependent methyltransferase [Rickettsia endosymbiont of Oxypoda opaca]
MKNWQLKAINNAYKKTTELRNNNYIINPHIINLIGNIKGKTVLEVGCGFGRYLEILSKHTPSKLVGCDISAHQIQLCIETVKNNDIEYYIMDFSDANSSIVLGQNKYDIVYNVFVILYIETLDKLKTFIENCYKCLKKGGKIVICTLDILGASFYPEVFNILKLPTKPLTKDNKYIDGCPIQIEIIENCTVTSYQRNFETIKQLMEQVGFTDVRKCDLFLDEIALQAFTDKELNIIKKSNIFLLLEAKKL